MNYSKAWFDKLSVDNVEFADDVGLHVFARRHNCRLFRLPVSFFEQPDFFPRVWELAETEWKKPELHPRYLCPGCGANKASWARRYESREFCGRCGRDY